jgi:peptidoglycan/xylan/chitin deacetylase (PgdA/CDA1 family)
MDLILKGATDARQLALTIDDFPSSGTTEANSGSMALLDDLKELNIPATFFCIGERVHAHHGLAARAVQEGHELGNHMARDQWSILLNQEQFLEQLDFTANAITEDLKRSWIPPVQLRWFRPSGGWPTPRMVEWAEGRGYKTVLGLIWPFDGLSVPLLSREMRLEFQQRLVEHLAHPGGIIVLHDTREFNPLTRETLREVVPILKDEEFSFVTLSQLLAV